MSFKVVKFSMIIVISAACERRCDRERPVEDDCGVPAFAHNHPPQCLHSHTLPHDSGSGGFLTRSRSRNHSRQVCISLMTVLDIMKRCIVI